jgi:release factor glutamine methyltransferase
LLLCRMKTIKDVFVEYRTGLVKLYVANEIETITLFVINEISGLSKTKIKAFPEQEISAAQSEKLSDILLELKTGKPVQYILGMTEFYGLPFKVNPSVLIPRPETEELVEWALSSVGGPDSYREQFAEGRILDIGTGSGCIAISLKKNLPGFEVSAIDVSTAALETAKENAELNHVDVEFIKADILNLKSEIEIPKRRSPLEPLKKISNSEKFEIIISNPPYVTLHDKTQMHTNVTDFEPHTALFVPENDPLVFYKAIADFALSHLAPNGLLFFEINESYGKEIVDLLAAKNFKNIELRTDITGRNRFIKATLAFIAIF